MIIDTHAHFYAEEFNDDREDIIKDAFENGVEKIFLPNIDIDSIEGMMDLAKKYPSQCYPMMGLHPCYIKNDFEKQLEEIHSWFSKEKFYAVGEIGIDLYWDKSTLDIQKEAFKIQIQWAKDMNLPIVIHVRDSFNKVFEVIDEMNDEKLTGIFHCFTGDKNQAQKIIEYGGFKMGLGGVLTFKNSDLKHTIEDIDLKHFVLETDSPYLTPHPNRGKRNEPKYTELVAQKLAEIKDIELKDIEEITTANAFEIFSL